MDTYYPTRVRDMVFPQPPTEAELAAKAEADRKERLKNTAAKILEANRQQAEREAAEQLAAERQRRIKKVNLLIDQALLTTLASEKTEVLKRIAAKYSHDQVLGMDDYNIAALYSDELMSLRTERERD